MPRHAATFLKPVDDILDSLSPPLVAIARSLRYNLGAVSATAGIPFSLAVASVHSARFQQLHIAEKIEGGDDEPDGAALERARTRMREEQESSEGKRQLADATCHFLLHVAASEDTTDAAAELLRQGTVLAWASLEVAVRDVFVAYLNRVPTAAKRLVTDPSTRQLFPLKALEFELLERYQFDLSASMGHVMASLHDIADLPTIKQIVSALFPRSPALGDLLNRKQMWMLSQRRHLIVHRRAVVDDRYNRETGETLPLGSTLLITPTELKESLLLVRDAGIELILAASADGIPGERA